MENTLKSKLLVIFTVLFMNANFTVRAQKFDPSHYTMYSQAIEFLMDDHDDCNCNNLFVEKDLFSVSYSCLTPFSDESEITGASDSEEHEIKEIFKTEKDKGKDGKFSKFAYWRISSKYKGKPIGENIYADPSVYTVKFSLAVKLLTNSEDFYIFSYFNSYNKFIPGGNAYLFVFDQKKKLKNVIYGDGYTF